MKQTDYPVPSGSALVAGMVSDAIVGAITGMTTVRRLIFRIILFVAAVSFAIGMLFRDYLPKKPAPTAQAEAPAREPAKTRQTQPPPRERDDPEETQQLIRKEPL